MKIWKIFLAIIGGGLLFILLIVGIIAGALSLIETPTKELSNNRVLTINFAENIVDAPRINMFEFDPMNISMDVNTPITLYQTLAAIEKAAIDPTIKGICIRPDGVGIVSDANLEELRQALERFKTSGKFVVAYDDNYTQAEYYFASVADQVYLHPEGSLAWNGISSSVMFYKGLLDKLDVEVEIFRPSVCRYKSAVEPFFLTKMSKENREQMEKIVNSMWDDICEEVHNSRNIDVDLLKSYAKNATLALSEDALNAGFVDKLIYEDELLDILDSYGVNRNRFGHHNSVSLGEYVNLESKPSTKVSINGRKGPSFTSSQLVAVVYADGQIVDGDVYADDYIYGTTLARQLRQVRLDEKTKAVVLRVNSPGGSALASDVVWREMVLLQQTKPVVVSMGSMAASGGYYISTPADLIVADRLTLTGSIGVFGMVPNIEKLMKNKLGLTIDSANTSPAANTMNLFTPLTEESKRSISISVDRVYKTFTEHVAEGRNLSIEQVYNVAEGRVWSGSDAIECGLVDKIGGLSMAINEAINLADISSDFMVYEFTAPVIGIEALFESFGMFFASTYGIDYNIYGEELLALIKKYPFLFLNNGIQAYQPGKIEINL